MEEINIDIDHSTNVYWNIKATREEKTAKKLAQNIKDDLSFQDALTTYGNWKTGEGHGIGRLGGSSLSESCASPTHGAWGSWRSENKGWSMQNYFLLCFKCYFIWARASGGFSKVKIPYRWMVIIMIDDLWDPVFYEGFGLHGREKTITKATCPNKYVHVNLWKKKNLKKTCDCCMLLHVSLF